MTDSDQLLASETELSDVAEKGLVPRRAFLKKSALAGLGVTALYVAPQFTSVVSKPAYASITQVCVPEYCVSWGSYTRTIEPFVYNGTVQEFYNYAGGSRNTAGETEHNFSANTPWNYFDLVNTNYRAIKGIEEIEVKRSDGTWDLVGDILMFFLLKDKYGKISLFTILDSPNDGDGGSAKICYTGLPSGVTWSVKDDSGLGGDSHTVDGAGNATLDTAWEPCCTDGGVLSFLPDCEGTVCVSFKSKGGSVLSGIRNVCFATPRSTDGKTVLYEIGKNPFCIEAKAP